MKSRSHKITWVEILIIFFLVGILAYSIMGFLTYHDSDYLGQSYKVQYEEEEEEHQLEVVESSQK